MTEIGTGMARAATEAWQVDDTERWLTDYPLPATFKWNGARAYPKYRLKKGYGFWLRTAGPYYPALRGLFMLCHDTLAGLPVGQPMPNGEDLAAMLTKQSGQQSVLQLSAEDMAPPEHENPAENSPARENEEGPF